MTNSLTLSFSGHPKLNARLTGPSFTLVDRATQHLTRWWDWSVPEGYEDETGFHFAPARFSISLFVESPAWLGENI